MAGQVSHLSVHYLLSLVVKYSIEINFNTFGEDDMLDKTFFTIEQTGYDLGQRIMEKLIITQIIFLKEELEIFKFICRDFWQHIFSKQIDNLKTNHKVFPFL
jgi:trafficking protein particle complex subunit 6